MIDTEKIENKCLMALKALQDIMSEITALLIQRHKFLSIPHAVLRL